MDLNVLGNLGDFIGGIAVVVTLVYLALQIRQNTSVLKTASRQAVAEGYRDCNRLRMDPAAALAWTNGLTSYPDLPFEEKNYFNTIIIDEALFFQGAFALYESGQLEEQTYSAYLAWFSSIVTTPGGTVWWETTGRPIFVPSAVSAVDARLAQGGLHDIRQLPASRLDE
ncbi:MAG: hypothetical protein AB8G23_24625 [Myxococcota bacterium]